jgi:hypothetical protein
LTRVSVVTLAQVYCSTWSCIPSRSIRMLDLILLAVGIGFFVLAIGYTIACDRL